MYRFLEFLETYRLQHRNSQKRVYISNTSYFLTCKTHHNFPYFRERIFCDLFVENLKLCKQLKGFLLFGWVLIDDHFHLLVHPNEEFDISNVMFSIKKQFSHDMNRIMGFNKLYPHMKVGKRLPTFGGMDELITHHQNYVNLLNIQFQQKHKNQNPFPKFQWQESFHDHYIRNQNDFDHHMAYIAYNPEKHCMPDNWGFVFTNEKYNTLTDEFI